MQVVNPFNRVPETREMLARACHCICSYGSLDAYEVAEESQYLRCYCSCGSGIENENANFNSAYTTDLR